LYIDLGAELIGAELNEQKIAVEIKLFLSASLVSDFHTALGQFLNYRSVLRRQQPEQKLYLAVPQKIDEDFFQTELVRIAILDHSVDIIVYNIENEGITWKPSN
jgi:ribonuclease BN (tRNA processing enzyme)